MKRWFDVRGGFAGLSLTVSDPIDKDDFAAFAAELRKTLDPQAPAAAGVLAALQDCEAAIDTDDAAELVRKGFRLGEWLATAERDRYYQAVLGLNRKRGQITKDKKHARRNESMAAMYRAQEPIVGCLNARRQLRDDKEISLQQVNNILRAEGVKLRK